jgi:hypothetical protein
MFFHIECQLLLVHTSNPSSSSSSFFEFNWREDDDEEREREECLRFGVSLKTLGRWKIIAAAESKNEAELQEREKRNVKQIGRSRVVYRAEQTGILLIIN